MLYYCFVGILVSRSLRRTPFRVCFSCHSAVMLPTHDELVLIAATNQPAVQAVAEAGGTPAVPGTPAQTPLSETLAWVGIPSDAWNAFNEELGGVTRVRDIVNISTTDWENAIPPTHPVRMWLGHGSGRFGDTTIGWLLRLTTPSASFERSFLVPL